MTNIEERELISQAILLAQTLREELPAIRLTLAQIKKVLEEANVLEGNHPSRI